ncbi:MAG: hypothetical protein ACE5IC_10090 [Candidatus Brocadiales bacterium]
MTIKEATAEVFYTAFKALNRKQKDALLAKMLKDPEFKEDLVDLVLIEQARKEPGEDISLDEYLEKKV